MANNSEILRILREATLSEAKPVGLVQTDKIIGQSKGENDAYYKDVKKKMSDYEKASTSSMEGAIEEPKFNYDNNDEVEYHEDMEILNGMEMLNYERKPSEKFTQRAKEAIEGSSNMGNNPEWANVYPEQKGFTGPDFGKKLVDRIERSKKKRDAATPTFDQFGDDIEEKNVGVNKSKSAYKPSVSKKPVAIGESTIKENEEKTFKISYWVQNNDDYEDRDTEIKAKSKEEALEKFRGKDNLEARVARNVTATVVENMPIKPKVKPEPNKRLDIPVSPVERKTAPPRIKQEPNPISESEVDPRNTHFIVEKESGKIIFAYDYTDEGPEYAKDALKYSAKDDIRDMFDRNPNEFKIMTKQGLIKQGIDPMDTKNWVESASVDMGENYNKNTNESKMKGKQINELSPSTYNAITQAGKDRGDSRGASIAATAQNLKYRESNNQPYSFRLKGGGQVERGETMDLQIKRDNYIVTIENRNHPTFEITIDIEDMKFLNAISLEYDNTRERSNAIEFDRKTAGNISKAVQNVLGYTFPPNLLPQFVEEKQIKNESKMKRLKFKKPFNGVDTALKVIPESYKVDNRVFELTDGNEHYSVRWEGSLNEGKAVVLSSFHQEALNEDVAKIKHLMGFKSQDTLGNLKGGQRLTEDNTFFDMLNKSKALNEAEAKPDFLDLDGDGDKEEPMKKASKEADHEKSIEEADVVAGGAQPPQNLKNDVEMLFNTLSKNSNLVNKINKINNPIEKSQFMVKVAELIGLDLNLFSKTVQQLKSQAKQQVGENSYLKKK